MTMNGFKCSFCSKKAEFYFQKDENVKKKYFCENHAIEFMKREKVDFLQRVD